MILKEEPFSPLETFYAYYLVPSNQFCCLYWTYAQNKKTLAAVHCFYLSYTQAFYNQSNEKPFVHNLLHLPSSCTCDKCSSWQLCYSQLLSRTWLFGWL